MVPRERSIFEILRIRKPSAEQQAYDAAARENPPPRRPAEPLTAGKLFMVGIALILVVLFIKGFTATAHAATVHADAERTSDTALTVRLDVTVRSGTSIYLQGCADLDGILACGNGAAKRRKLHKGHNTLAVRVTNTVMEYRPPPAGTTEAWDAWAYGPGQTDVAFLWFKGKKLLTELKPAAVAAETLKDGRTP